MSTDSDPKPAIYDPVNDPEGAKRADEFLAKANATPEAPVTPLISIEDFGKVKLVTAEVVSASEIPKADKLLCLQVKVGGEFKQIVAGIKQYYSAVRTPPRNGVDDDSGPPCIVGKTIIIVNNLQPTKLRGCDSNGMLLAVRTPEGLKLLTTDGPCPSGLPVG